MSKVNWVRPLLLSIILVGLGTFAYWLEYSHKPKQEEQETASKKIFNLNKDTQVASIRIIDQTVDTGKQFAFKCLDLEAKLCKPSDQSKWEITEPLKIKADESNVNSLLSTIYALSSSETIDLGTEKPEKRSTLLKEYKLDSDARKKTGKGPGIRRIEITMAKGETLVAYLGETHPIGETIFALAGQDENRVFLIPTYIKSNFDHDLTYWRDKKLFSISSHQVQSFALDSPKLKVSAKRKDSQWLLKSGQNLKKDEFPGDIENIDNFLSGITYLNAKQFVTENKIDAKAKSTLQGTSRLLSFTLDVSPEKPEKNEEKITLTIYEKKDKTSKKGGTKKDQSNLYVTVSNLDPLYELDSSAKMKFEKTLKELRLSKLITTMERYSIKRIEFLGKSLGTSPLILAQTDAKWQKMPEKLSVDQDKVQGLLDKLSGNRIQEFLEGSAIPTGEQEGLQVFLGDEKSEKKRQLLFWKNGDKFYARDLHSTRKEAFRVDPAIKEALPWSRDFLSPAPPSPAPLLNAKKAT